VTGVFALVIEELERSSSSSITITSKVTLPYILVFGYWHLSCFANYAILSQRLIITSTKLLVMVLSQTLPEAYVSSKAPKHKICSMACQFGVHEYYQVL